MSTAKEAELCLFVMLGAGSKAMLNSKRGNAQYMIQAETNSTTDKGMRVTNRVRRTVTFDDRGETDKELYEAATKFRLPRTAGSINSECIETEVVIDEHGFRQVLAFAGNIHHKFRHSIPMNELKIEIDHYVPPGEIYGGAFAKIDIEGAEEKGLSGIMELLRQHGITFVDVINPPGVESDGIKQRIQQLMAEEYNHVNCH
ncbi:hypothetical protein CF95_gp044 [Erwinia phage PhiEaH1]|uniref:Methyltransferase FkbM domain-containing protein n=1 Tax=Erwinia phage PhiEaH1 TaxID=1401669 RepID=W8CZL1_9CAUD|nr:hypothetical protein CF95_gp044 [Erwinia phage PhiEaH1]AGX01766.1 hypothetical protein [Erwinia phage PhiEaH1]